MNTQYLNYWILVFGCLCNTVMCQVSGSESHKNQIVIVGSIILVLGLFFSILFYLSKCTGQEVKADVENAAGNNADQPPSHDSIFVIESSDPPPKYCELLCEAPPPSFDSLFPVPSEIAPDVETDRPNAMQQTTSVETICEKS